MKLRFQSNSVRLRLKRSEVAQLAETGCVEEKIVWGSGPNDVFSYVVESSHAVSAPQVTLKTGGLLVQVPIEAALHWARGNEVGIEAMQAAGGGSRLHILIEKDFACLNGPAEENVDTFANPLAGTKC